jgi:hypothetical protein
MCMQCLGLSSQSMTVENREAFSEETLVLPQAFINLKQVFKIPISIVFIYQWE